MKGMKEHLVIPFWLWKYWCCDITKCVIFDSLTLTSAYDVDLLVGGDKKGIPEENERIYLILYYCSW